MMAVWQMVVISIGLSLDVFAWCLYKGAMISEVNIPAFTKVVSLFTGFQMGMMVVGNLITRIPAIHDSYQSASLIWTFLAAVTFFFLGIYMIVKSQQRKKHRKIEEQKQDTYNYRMILFWCFMTSIDALIAGIGFGFMGVQLLFIALIIAVISAASAVVGLFCGYRLGCGPMNTCVTIGGCLVLIGAVNLLASYIGAVV